MFGANGKADGVRPDAGFHKLLFGKLGVGRAGRMDSEGFDVCHICQQREKPQMVDKRPRFRRAAFDLKGEDTSGPAWKIPFIQSMGRIIRQRRVVDPFYLWVAI